LGPTLAASLGDAGIDGPEDVSASNLALLPKVGPTRAGRLLSAFIAAGPVYEVVGELVPAGLDARLAGRVVDALGPGAARLLRDDPWQLLVVWGATPADADRLARALIPDVRRDDPRRGRALVGYVLARQARDGHTVSPAGLVGDA
jgi:exodeoxyribonuclease V alpha subunit